MRATEAAVVDVRKVSAYVRHFTTRNQSMLPTWIYGAVALSIALVAFGIGQFIPGMGIVFVALASTIWTAYSVSRRNEYKRNR